MANVVQHWTQNSTADFIYSISSNFVAQIETKIEQVGINQNDVADKMRKSNGRISQVLNNPGNLCIRSMVELARAVGMKVTIVAYDDHDPHNNRGPIDPDVFRKCWEYSDRPENLFDVERAFTPTKGFEAVSFTCGSESQSTIAGGTAWAGLQDYNRNNGIFQIILPTKEAA